MDRDGWIQDQQLLQSNLGLPFLKRTKQNRSHAVVEVQNEMEMEIHEESQETLQFVKDQEDFVRVKEQTPTSEKETHEIDECPVKSSEMEN